MHTARLTMDYFYHEGIEVMDWPAWSPDLNPIEQVWDYLYRQISRRDRPPLTVQGSHTGYQTGVGGPASTDDPESHIEHAKEMSRVR